jgi:hypothetical protein
VDKAAGGRVGGGRGVGIGLTWDARAVVERNRVTRYWKGIGIFVEAEADVRENIVEDILTWGIALWGPDGATPAARIERNVVYRTGACGVMIDRPDGESDPGTLTDNLIMRTGQNERYDSGEPYCWQRPLARHHVPAGFVERGNVLFDNRQPPAAGAAPPPLAELDALPQAAANLLRTLGTHAAHAGAVVLREVSAWRGQEPPGTVSASQASSATSSPAQPMGSVYACRARYSRPAGPRLARNACRSGGHAALLSAALRTSDEAHRAVAHQHVHSAPVTAASRGGSHDVRKSQSIVNARDGKPRQELRRTRGRYAQPLDHPRDL